MLSDSNMMGGGGMHRGLGDDDGEGFNFEAENMGADNQFFGKKIYNNGDNKETVLEDL